MGFTLLSSAIGGLELMGFCDDEIDKFEACFHENSCKSYCCLLHAEENLLISKKDHRMTILSLLEKRGFSQGFIGFLCNCLKFNWETRTTMQNIIGSPFLNSLSISTTSLKDLIKVGLFYEYIEGETSITRAGFLEKLVESLKVVLPNCEKWFLKEEYKPYIIHLIPFNEGNKVFHVLEKELGVSRGNVFEKIRTVFQGFGFLI